MCRGRIVPGRSTTPGRGKSGIRRRFILSTAAGQLQNVLDGLADLLVRELVLEGRHGIPSSPDLFFDRLRGPVGTPHPVDQVGVGEPSRHGSLTVAVDVVATDALALENDAARRDVAAASINLGQSLIAAADGERGEAGEHE
jgi:hypothetical protein